MRDRWPVSRRLLGLARVRLPVLDEFTIACTPRAYHPDRTRARRFGYPLAASRFVDGILSGNIERSPPLTALSPSGFIEAVAELASRPVFFPDLNSEAARMRASVSSQSHSSRYSKAVLRGGNPSDAFHG